MIAVTETGGRVRGPFDVQYADIACRQGMRAPASRSIAKTKRKAQ